MHATLGPIARSLIAQVRGVKAQKVVDLSSWNQAKKQAADFEQQNRPSADALDNVGPEFALYAYVNNWAISMLELLQDAPDLRKYIQKFAAAE